MPSKTKAQHNFMAGCAHGMKPKGGRSCPPQKVSKEFLMADALRKRGNKHA